MRIGIFGRHPIPQPGFMGVMSLFEAIYFSRQGNVVHLILPFITQEVYEKFLATYHLKSLNELQKYNGHFEIIPLIGNGRLSETYDCIVYQSYDPNDFDIYFTALRRAATILTKNFPKFVPSPNHAFHESVESNFRTFDVVACALHDDVTELRMNPWFWEKYGAQVTYVPRGADPGMLHPGRKLGGRPTIGLEIPFTAEGRPAIEFYIEPLRRLQQIVPDLRVLTLGQEPHPEIDSEHIHFGQFDTIYEKYFNEIWLHLIMDYRKSPVHVSAPVQKLHPNDWSGRAIYEVQNIEAQMSGAIVVGHPDNTIAELIQPGTSALYITNYDDSSQITSLLRAGLDNFALLSQGSRAWATANFSWEYCMKLWADALDKALDRRV